VYSQLSTEREEKELIENTWHTMSQLFEIAGFPSICVEQAIVLEKIQDNEEVH
jgi:protein-disulfide isomerase-like protein with CxxC motif